MKRKPERKAHATERTPKVALSASEQLTQGMKEHKLFDADVADALSPPASAAAVTRWRSGIRTPRRKVWREQLFKMFKIPPPAWTDAEGKRAAWLAKHPPGEEQKSSGPVTQVFVGRGAAPAPKPRAAR